MSLYYWLVGHRSRANYWSCTKFADKIRTVFDVSKKPSSATSKEWRDWKNKNAKNIGYWITEEGLNHLQDVVMFIPDVYHNVRIYIRNRCFDKPHYLDTKLKRGQWHEFDTRILYGLFESLVDFVEVEKAQMQLVSEILEKERKDRSPYWFGRGRKNKFLPSRELGLKHLDWEINLGDESPIQSETANEVKKLYLWWKDVRPYRSDPHDESGWSEYCKQKRSSEKNLLMFDVDEIEKDKVKSILEKSAETEQAYDDEDTEMLIRLIKIRKECWT